MQGCGFGRIRPYLAILTAVAACAVLAAPASADSFVTRTGDKLFLDGARTASPASTSTTRTRRPLLVHAGRSQPRPLVTRSSPSARAASSGPGSSRTSRPRAASRDWTAFDRTLAALAAHGLRVDRDARQPVGGLRARAYRRTRTTPGTRPATRRSTRSGTVSYRDWVAEVVERYEDDPTILAWEPLNEPEVKPPRSTPAARPVPRRRCGRSWPT